jgi:arylformamidase
MNKLGRIVDLSHTLIPEEEEYRFEIDTRPTEQWEQFKQYKRLEGHWYVLSEICFSTHVGTHIELPYHHDPNGKTAETFPLEDLVGEAIVIDISRWGHNDCIPAEELKKVCAGRIRNGDIVYFYTGLDKVYPEKRHNRPWFETAGIVWLAEQGIKVMGVDTSGIEIRNPDGSPPVGQPNHEALLGQGIALVEFLTHLEEFLDKRFYTFILPVKVRGAEAFPVRIIGMEME